MGHRSIVCLVPACAVVLSACALASGEGVGTATQHLAAAATCGGQLPDPTFTPGKLCSPSDPDFQGYRYAEGVAYCGRDVLPEEKAQVAAHYGIAPSDYSKYEFDHYFPLAMGGSNSIENLWPQPKAQALVKDKVEQAIYDGMSAGTMTQADAAARIRAWRPSPLPQGCAAPPVPPERAKVGTAAASLGKDSTVFVILMENHNWSDIVGSASAPYINGTLLPQGSYADNYQNVPGLHPSEPNYLWLEAGDNFGVTDDATPSSNSQTTRDHLVSYLEKAGISWKSYQEGISGRTCPLTATGKYAPKHNPMIFFEDVTDGNSKTSQHCIDHVRPYSELEGDLAADKAPHYVFITPDLCDDMHDNCTGDSIAQGDSWLAAEMPKILGSAAYKRSGVVFITWDESEGGDFPIGMIALSPFAKGGGYHNSIAYSHSSTLRSVQEIFGVTPFLGDAANATDLADLFKSFPSAR